MKLVTYIQRGLERVGFYREADQCVVPAHELDLKSTEMNDLIRELDAVSFDFTACDLSRYKGIPAENVQMISPIPNPEQDVICLGLNYHDHADEADKKLWPAETGKLNFQAVSPASYGTVINTPADNVAALGLTVTVPSTVTDQKDVIFGHAESKTYASNATVVPLAFEHAMSQIVFQGKVAEENMTATIKGVKVCNVKNTANIGYLGAIDAVNTQYRALAVTEIGATVDSYPIGMFGGADKVVSTTTATDLCAADGALIMIPQSGATAWDPTAGSISDANTAGLTYLEIECKIKYNDKDDYILGSAEAYGKIYVPFTIDWAIGKKYTYVLNFGTGSGGYDEEGQELMNYISFSVASVEDWTVIAGAEYTI